MGRTARTLALATALFVALTPSLAVAAPSTTRDPGVWGTDGTVYAILATPDAIYVGGTFTHLVSPDGLTTIARNALAALDPTTGEPLPLDVPVTGRSGLVDAFALSADGSKLYIGGDFDTVAGIAKNRLAALDLATGTLATTWRAGASYTVHDLAVSGNIVYVAGGFTALKATPRNRLGALDATTGALLPWAPSADNIVRALVVLADGRILAGGDFASMNGDNSQNYVSALDAVSGAVTSWAFHPSEPLLDLVRYESSIFAAGGGGGGHAFAFDGSSGARLWQTDEDGDVQAVTVAGGQVIIGGHFIYVSGIKIQRLAALDPTTGVLDATWIPRPNSTSGVWALGSLPTKLWVGGAFTYMGTVQARHVARFSVTPVVGAPFVTILSPSNGSTFDSGATEHFEATATDQEDGDVTASLVWTSSQDGTIGTGGSFDAVLSDGVHTITATATDSDGYSRSASVTIAVGQPKVKVASIAYSLSGGQSQNKHLLVTLTVKDGFGNPVYGANVSIRLDKDGAPYATGSGTTGTTGRWTYQASNAPSGCYTTTVTSLTATALVWDGITPVNSYCKV